MKRFLVEIEESELLILREFGTAYFDPSIPDTEIIKYAIANTSVSECINDWKINVKRISKK